MNCIHIAPSFIPCQLFLFFFAMQADDAKNLTKQPRCGKNTLGCHSLINVLKYQNLKFCRPETDKMHYHKRAKDSKLSCYHYPPPVSNEHCVQRTLPVRIVFFVYLINSVHN